MATWFPTDEHEDIMQRGRKAIQRSSGDAVAKEAQERAEAASALATENEKHFVDFMNDCVKQSYEQNRETRRIQQECWRIFNEEAPPSFSLKDPWQSKVIPPKPFAAVKFAESMMRKAFKMDFLTIEGYRQENRQDADFLRKFMTYQLSKPVSNFAQNITDAAGVGLAIGTSSEIIPYWRPWQGLAFNVVEPWKIYRDPTATSRDAQSGMYWIHKEWVDEYVLKDKAKSGKYQNVDQLKYASFQSGSGDPELSKEEEDRRRGVIWQASPYRNLYAVYEFWGTILDDKGNVLLPNGTFTVAGERIIEAPRPSYYPTLRWPGTGFSPIPHYFRFDGRGILQGIRSVWYCLANLLSLHVDNLNWLVNPMREINQDALIDPSDNVYYPGKDIYTRETVAGQQVVRTVQQPDITGGILANANYISQLIEEGDLVRAGVQGLPGYRAEVTARESAQNLEQSKSVFIDIGDNVDDGALSVINAANETIAINMSFEELVYFTNQEEAQRYYDESVPERRVSFPTLATANFKVSGVAGMMRNFEMLQAIRENVLPMAQSPLFVPYLKPYYIAKAIERRAGLQDENLFIEEEHAEMIDEQQQQAQEEEIEMQRRATTAGAEQAEAEAVDAMMPPPPTGTGRLQ